jgi:hypothetical protein
MALGRFLAFTAALALVAAVKSAGAEEDVYDPLRASDRPKMFVDYVTGPLRGRNENEDIFMYEHWARSCNSHILTAFDQTNLFAGREKHVVKK